MHSDELEDLALSSLHAGQERAGVPGRFCYAHREEAATRAAEPRLNSTSTLAGCNPAARTSRRCIQDRMGRNALGARPGLGRAEQCECAGRGGTGSSAAGPSRGWPQSRPRGDGQPKVPRSLNGEVRVRAGRSCLVGLLPRSQVR